MGHTNFNLQRFLDAQEDMYPVALKEIRKGGKQSHWIWYIFPQETGIQLQFTILRIGWRGGGPGLSGASGTGDASAGNHPCLAGASRALYSTATDGLGGGRAETAQFDAAVRQGLPGRCVCRGAESVFF